MHSILRIWKQLYEANPNEAVSMIVNFVLKVLFPSFSTLPLYVCVQRRAGIMLVLVGIQWFISCGNE